MITEVEMRALFVEFLQPLYVVLGGIAALAVIIFAVWFVIRPFWRRMD